MELGFKYMMEPEYARSEQGNLLKQTQRKKKHTGCAWSQEAKVVVGIVSGNSIRKIPAKSSFANAVESRYREGSIRCN